MARQPLTVSRWLLLALFPATTFAFLSPPRSMYHKGAARSAFEIQKRRGTHDGIDRSNQIPLPSRKWGTTSMLAQSAGSVEITTPTPDEAAAMGARDWPQQLKRGTWDERIPEGQTVVRYVLDGTGAVELSTYSSDGREIDDSTKKKKAQVGPGSLIEVTGKASISWKADEEMIILTPGFEEGGKLLLVAAAMVALCGALIAGVGGG